MDLSEAIKIKITNLMYSKNITMSKLSSLAGISRTTLTRFFSGKTRFLRIDIIEYICEGVGISLEEFFRGKESYEVEVKEE